MHELGVSHTTVPLVEINTESGGKSGLPDEKVKTNIKKDE